MKFNIVLPDVSNVTNGDIDISVFEKFGNVISYPMSKVHELEDRLECADIILCNKTLLNEETLKKADNLKYIGLFSTGYNNVDLDYINKKNIVVSNAAGYSTNSVAAHTFGLILNFYNKINAYDNFVKMGKWKESLTFTNFDYPMYELDGKTIGIVGFGSIGRKVAKISASFDMNILVYSRNKENVEKNIEKYFGYYENISYASLDEIKKEDYIITFHCPLNEDSEKMINKEFLSSCKKKPFIVNTARGGLVNENDLYFALNEGIIKGAALDVIDTEPMLKDCILCNAKNITITPHVAWAPIETRKRLVDIVADNLKAFLEGNPVNVVNR